MGEADSRNYQGRFLSEDYTMGDLIRNSNAREASKLKESELREQIRFEHQSKELKAKMEGWVEANNNALSYMYLFGKDFKDGKAYFEKHGMHYEHSAKDLESIRLRDYLSDYVTDEQRMSLRSEYNKIMKAPKDDWQSQLLKNQMITNSATMNKFGQQNEADIQGQVNAIAAAKKEEEERCDGVFNELKCAGEAVGSFFSDALGFVGEGINHIPVVNSYVGQWSDRYEDVKTGVSAVGNEIKNSGAAGEWVYNAGDFANEALLTHTMNQIVTPGIDANTKNNIIVGTDIEDTSLMDVGEAAAGIWVPGADVALAGHQAVQINKAKQEQEAANKGKTDIDQAIDKEYGSDEEEPQPTRLIQEPQHSSKPKGQTNYAYKPPTVERDTVIKGTAPPPKPSTAPSKVIEKKYWLGDGPVKNNEPSLKPREPPKGYGQKPTSGGGTCKPKRKPIPACN